MHRYPDVLYGQYCAPGGEPACGDIFFFDYGCITFWGLSQKQARPPSRAAARPPGRRRRRSLLRRDACDGRAGRPCLTSPRARRG